MTSTFAIAALAAFAAIGTAAPANAERASEAHIAAVQYGDLDLTTDQGQSALQRRIESAARDVCGMAERATGSIIPSLESRRCYARARENIDREIAVLVDRQTQRGG